jgi:hypothetical protein
MADKKKLMQELDKLPKVTKVVKPGEEMDISELPGFRPKDRREQLMADVQKELEHEKKLKDIEKQKIKK